MGDNNPNPPGMNAPAAPAFDANFTNAIAAAIAQAVTALQQQQQAPPAAVPHGPPVYSLTPALARQGVLDFTDPGEYKIYYKAIEPLPTKFSLTEPNIKVFLNELGAKSAAW